MSEARRRRIATWLVTALVGVPALSTFVAAGWAEQTIVPIARDSAPSTSDPPPSHDPFSRHPADLGALTWDDLIDEQATRPPLPVETRQSVTRTEEWAELTHGPPVTSAWSKVTAAGVTQAQTREAEYAAGLEGVADLGVLP